MVRRVWPAGTAVIGVDPAGLGGKHPLGISVFVDGLYRGSSDVTTVAEVRGLFVRLLSFGPQRVTVVAERPPPANIRFGQAGRDAMIASAGVVWGVASQMGFGDPQLRWMKTKEWRSWAYGKTNTKGTEAWKALAIERTREHSPASDNEAEAILIAQAWLAKEGSRRTPKTSAAAPSEPRRSRSSSGSSKKSGSKTSTSSTSTASRGGRARSRGTSLPSGESATESPQRRATSAWQRLSEGTD